MNKFIKQLISRWELSVLAVSILFSFALVLLYLFAGRGENDVSSSSKAFLNRDNLLSDGAFAFLAKGGQEDEETLKNPFSPYMQALSQPKPKAKPMPRQSAPKAAPEVKAEPVVPMPPQTLPKPVQPALNYIIGSLTFTFQNITNTGKTMAIISVERQGKGTEVLTLGVGDEWNGMKILGISQDAIAVQDAKKGKGRIPIYGTSKLWLLAE